ncbi:MAG: hypothetical protein KJ023_21000 [Burkholderiaceae bacterium]|nr:hypothetical protein [Burkholderiaceae bacterium]
MSAGGMSWREVSACSDQVFNAVALLEALGARLAELGDDPSAFDYDAAGMLRRVVRQVTHTLEQVGDRLGEVLPTEQERAAATQALAAAEADAQREQGARA